MADSITFDGAKMDNGWLCIHPSSYTSLMQSKAFCYDFKGIYDADLKQHRERRSLNANAYAWKLITEIGNVLRADKDAVYFDMLKRYGQGGAVSVEEKYADSFRKTWKYCESIGKTELHGKTFEHFRFWVGSSNYNTQEMSILIDGIVSEAKALDIETLTEKELSLLKEEW